MSVYLIGVTGVIYAYIGIEQGAKGNLGMCITYLSYALANVGLALSATK